MDFKRLETPQKLLILPRFEVCATDPITGRPMTVMCAAAIQLPAFINFSSDAEETHNFRSLDEKTASEF